MTKEEKEDTKNIDFPSSYKKIMEGERKLDESKAPEWMDAKINTKEVDISIDG
jgi:hypothetical protein